MTVTEIHDAPMRRMIDALNEGPIERDAETAECRACGAVVSARHYGAHVRQAHVKAMPRESALLLDNYVACSHCDAVVAVNSVVTHERDRHGVYQSGRRRPSSKGVEVSRAPARSAASRSDVTASEAGLAVIRGLCPGGAVPIELLSDVVEWLDEATRIVDAIRDA